MKHTMSLNEDFYTSWSKSLMALILAQGPLATSQATEFKLVVVFENTIYDNQVFHAHDEVDTLIPTKS